MAFVPSDRLRAGLVAALGLVGLALIGLTYTGRLSYQANERFVLVLFATGAALLSMVAVRANSSRDTHRVRWRFLAGLFGLFVIVKVLPVQSGFVRMLRNLDRDAGLQWSSIILVGLSVAVAVAAGAYLFRFLLSLPAGIQRRFIGGGIAFLLGAIVMEGFSEWAWGRYGADSAPYYTATLIEDVLEMTGLLAFIDGLLLALGRFYLPPRWTHVPGSGAGAPGDR